MSKVIRIIAIDPGNITGVAVMTTSEPVLGFQLGRECQRDRQRILEPCAGADAYALLYRFSHNYDGQLYVVVEGQFVPSRGGRGQKGRPQAVSILRTAQHAGGWKYLAQSLGLELWGTEVNPNGPEVQAATWRRAVYGRKHAYPTRAQAVSLATGAVFSFYGIKVPKSKEHTAEAILLAGFAMERITHGCAVQP